MRADDIRAMPARRGGPRAVPLHLNGVEIGIVKEPSDRGVEDQAFEQLCGFAVMLYAPGPAAAGEQELTRRQRCATRLLQSLGVEDPRSATVLSHLSIRRDAEGSMLAATWQFVP